MLLNEINSILKLLKTGYNLYSGICYMIKRNSGHQPETVVRVELCSPRKGDTDRQKYMNYML